MACGSRSVLAGISVGIVILVQLPALTLQFGLNPAVQPGIGPCPAAQDLF